MQAHLWRLTGFSFTSSEYTDAFLFVLALRPEKLSFCIWPVQVGVVSPVTWWDAGCVLKPAGYLLEARTLEPSTMPVCTRRLTISMIGFAATSSAPPVWSKSGQTSPDPLLRPLQLCAMLPALCSRKVLCSCDQHHGLPIICQSQADELTRIRFPLLRRKQHCLGNCFQELHPQNGEVAHVQPAAQTRQTPWQEPSLNSPGRRGFAASAASRLLWDFAASRLLCVGAGPVYPCIEYYINMFNMYSIRTWQTSCIQVRIFLVMFVLVLQVLACLWTMDFPMKSECVHLCMNPTNHETLRQWLIHTLQGGAPNIMFVGLCSSS
jgi:hypothetical protein